MDLLTFLDALTDRELDEVILALQAIISDRRKARVKTPPSPPR